MKILIPKISVSMKYILDKYEENMEAETIIETTPYEHELRKYYEENKEGVLSFIKCIQVIRKIKFNDDYRSFEKMALALSFKVVNFNETDGIPTIYDCVKAYLILKDKTGEEIDKYLASKFIEANTIMVPVEIFDIKEFIDSYLISSGRSDIIKSIIEYDKEDNKEFIAEQKKKLRLIEELLEDEF